MADIFHARARTFWFAARFLPSHRRQAVTGLYGFARAVDDLVDEPSPQRTAEQVPAVLRAWRDWLEHPTSLTPPNADVAAGVLPVLTSHGVPAAYLQLLVDGVASDLTRRDMRSWPELRAYCVQVASTVGLAMCHLLGAGDDALARQAAIELGVAMQLTNILRDVAADLDTGRVYLAADDLAAHGYSRERLAWLAASVARRGRDAIDEPFRELMRDQIARARVHYANGLEGVWRLPADCRLAILLAGRLYQAILDRIEAADYDVFSQRVATSPWHKLGEAVRSSFAVRRSTFASRPAAASHALADPTSHLAVSADVLGWLDERVAVQR